MELEDLASELDDCGVVLLEDSFAVLDEDAMLDDDFLTSTLFEKWTEGFAGRENVLDEVALDEDLISTISIELDSLFSGALVESPLHAQATIPHKMVIA